MKLKTSEIVKYSSRYPSHNDSGLLALKPTIASNGYLSLGDLKKVCRWKSARTVRHVSRNTNSEVEEITKFALNAIGEKPRIEVTQVLYGLNYPSASVILHFYHTDVYPIIDFRVLWTLEMTQPKSYNFTFWWQFVVTWRKEYSKARITIPNLSARDFDRALWQYSKDNQPI